MTRSSLLVGLCALVAIAASAPRTVKGQVQPGVYRCVAADGTVLYTTRPTSGCVRLFSYQPRRQSPTGPVPTPYVPRPIFRDYDCSEDCSGHRAGYDWAQSHDITDPDDCSGNSESFIEGCQAYAEEQENSSTKDDDDCIDEDNCQ